jgi:hypothetical protein
VKQKFIPRNKSWIEKLEKNSINHDYRRNENLGRGTKQRLHEEQIFSPRNKSWQEKLEQKYSGSKTNHDYRIEGTKI